MLPFLQDITLAYLYYELVRLPAHHTVSLLLQLVKQLLGNVLALPSSL